MRAIHIPSLLQKPEKTQVIEVHEHLPDLDTLMPVRGEVRVTHQGTYLEIQGQAETIVTLTCHRCLQSYNYRLAVSPREMLWLRETPETGADAPLEREVAAEDLVETLPPNGHFWPDDWLYQQLCLALPQRQLCQDECAGIAVEGNGKDKAVDQRWAALAKLKAWLPEES